MVKGHVTCIQGRKSPLLTKTDLARGSRRPGKRGGAILSGKHNFHV